jgi:phosphoribosylformylglycinamidine synthase subunit PurS
LGYLGLKYPPKSGEQVARVVVNVMLKPEILDPQGRAVQGALGRLGLTGVNDVRQGKQFVIDLAGELDADRSATLEKLAGELLSNPVIEDFNLTVVE